MKRAAALSIKRTSREKLFSGRLEKGKNNLFPTEGKGGGDVSLYLQASVALRTCHLFRVICARFFFSSRPKLATKNGLTRGRNRNEICRRETLFSE